MSIFSNIFGGNSQKRRISEYYLSMHFLVSLSATAVRRIRFDDSSAWIGRADANTTLSVSKPELFGGQKKEGGVSGKIDVMLGGPSQQSTTALAQRFSRTPATMPGFRGFLSLFLHGDFNSKKAKGFKQMSNVPYLKPLSVTVESIPTALAAFAQVDRSRIVGVAPREMRETKSGIPETALSPVVHTVSSVLGSAISPQNRAVTLESDGHWYDANPADIIFDIMTNTEVGAAIPLSFMDIDSFLDAQKTLFDENFGLTVIWTRQSSVQDFVQEMLNHIDAFLFTSTKTGKYTLKLVRKESDSLVTRELTPDNSNISTFKRKLWGETVNEITVTWTNPENEQEETVTAHDDANIGVQETVISDTRNYYAVRNRTLAFALAKRDVRFATEPLATAEVVANREFWDISPGDRVRLVSPEDGLSSLIMRVMGVDYGRIGESAIKISLLEDIYSKQAHAYTEPQSADVLDEFETALPITNYEVVTMPHALVTDVYGEGETDLLEKSGTLNRLMFLAEAPNEQHESFLMFREKTLRTGGTAWVQGGKFKFTDAGYLTDYLYGGATSLCNVTGVPYVDIEPNMIAVIGPGEGLLPSYAPGTVPSEVNGGFFDPHIEFATVVSVDSSGIILNRGMYDTVPVGWPQGTRVWFLDADSAVYENLRRGFKNYLSSQFVSVTGDDTRALKTSGDVFGTPGRRLQRPLRPNRVRINNHAPYNYSEAEACDSGTFEVVANTGTFPVSWKYTNRDDLPDPQKLWDSTDNTPETGVQAKVLFFKPVDGGIFSAVPGEKDVYWNEVPDYEFSSNVGALGMNVPISSLPGPCKYYLMKVYAYSTVSGLYSLQGKGTCIRVAGR